MKVFAEAKITRRFDILDVNDREMSLLIMALRGLKIGAQNEVEALLVDIERARDSASGHTP